MPDIKIIPGEKIQYRGFARRHGTKWYRHSKVVVDGVELKGSIQTKERVWGAIETTTCFENSCVMGQQIDWLIKMNHSTVSKETIHAS